MQAARVPSQDEVLQAFRKAGFTSLTPLQEKLISPILRGKDVAAEVKPGSGATVGYLLPLLLALRGPGTAPRALILAPSMAEVEKVARIVNRLARAIRDAPTFVPLGEIDDARREQRRLEKGAAVVVGTPDRVIDHIRRGGLVLTELSTVVLREPEGETRADFVKDAQFIFAKTAERHQTILFSHSALTEENELLRLLRHPVVVDSREIDQLPSAGHLFFMVDGASRADMLIRITLGLRVPSAVAFHSPRFDARGTADALRAAGLRVALLPQGSEKRNVLLAFSRRELDILLAPSSSGAPLALEGEDLAPSHVIYIDPPAGSNRPGGTGVRRGTTVFVLVDQGQERDLSRLQEAIGVAITRGELPSDDEVLKGAIDRILKRMKEEDPAELALLRSRIRRQVPLLQRPLFMASLLRAQLPLRPAQPPARQRPVPAAAGEPQGRPATTAVPPRGQRGRFGRNADSQQGGARAARPADGPRPQRAEPRGEGQFVQLFVSVGRNRRVFARDLTELFAEKLQLAEGDIGGVRVFEKYSFVDIVPARAGEAIAKLSGIELKGRAITVNYAKKKEEKDQK